MLSLKATDVGYQSLSSPHPSRRRKLRVAFSAVREMRLMLRRASSFPQGARRWRPAGALLTGGVAFPYFYLQYSFSTVV